MEGFFDHPIFGSQRPEDSFAYVRSAQDRETRRGKNVAGSYNHCVTRQGNLRSNESYIQMIENLGDAYEATEEMFGMIWWLAHMAPNAGPMMPHELVEQARQNYHIGLELAKANKEKRGPE